MASQNRAMNLAPAVGPHDHAQGPETAAVTLVQYGDYECSRSGQAYAAVEETQRQLGDRMRFVFRHFALPEIHLHSQNAAEAAEAAGSQGQFWEMHTRLFKHQQALGSGFLLEYADDMKLDTSRFLREMAAHTHAEHVRDDFHSGIESGVEGSPTFFINGVRYEDSWNGGGLLTAVEEAASSRGEKR